MLEVKGLSVAYGQHRALEGASLKIGRGEIVVILGANGAGKSTLLKAVSGICEGRTSGSISMQGRDILGMAPNKIVEEGIALVPEGRGVFGDLTVAENLKLGAHAPRARDEEAGNLDRVLRLFPKLHERRNQIVRTMSGGEQQMVAIGRAMMSNPVLLTLDEPSLGLSPLLCKELFQALKLVRDTGIGILLVEQNAKQSLAIADRGYLLENGHIVHEGRADVLRNDPAVQAAYLGGGKAAGQRPGGRTATTAASAPVFTAPSGPPRMSGASPADIAAAALAALPMAPARADVAAPHPATLPTRVGVVPPHPASASLGHPLPEGRGAVASAAADLFSPTGRLSSGDRRSEIDKVDFSEGRPERDAARRRIEASEDRAYPAPPPRPAPPTPALRGTADALLGGLSLNDIIAEASRASRAEHGTTMPSPPPRARTATPQPTSFPATPSLAMGNSQDRLKSVLKEIEDAAARARTWRPDQNRN
ncbi:ABC transporter ATP-binding protein [Rhizobium sp. RU36D]|uniref:ABC transporter ATP-binding protein n=1 Tax=Rhizobium sp. RU36D TaxID=1907415 RepID=UPI0009D82C90|nr:branched-chain amino acid transport system ATP-binding protein [Rhizobium sp. RU36D]